MKRYLANKTVLRALLAVTGLALGLGLDTQVMAARADTQAETQDTSVVTAITDKDVTAKVKQRLAAAPALKDADIGVTTVKGVVTLSGTVSDPHAKFAAAALAIQVPGVRILDDELKTASDNKPSADVRTGKSALYRSVPDSRITADVRQLLAQSLPKRYKVAARTDHGVVYLSGDLMDGNAIERIRGMVAQVDGVKGVNTIGLDAPFVTMAF